MTTRRSSGALSEAEADALLAGRAAGQHGDLLEIVGLMRSAATVPAPPPTAALAAVLDVGFAPLTVASPPRASHWARWSVRITAATAAAAAVTLGAATANALPAPVQTVVAAVVGALTPLELPRPPAPGEDSGRPQERPAGVLDPESDEPAADLDDDVVPAPAPSGPGAAVVAPPRPAPATAPSATASDGDEDAEPDGDEPDADAPETDAPETDGTDVDEAQEDLGDGDAPAGDASDSDEPRSEQGTADGADRDPSDPDAPEESDGDAGGPDVAAPDEPEADLDAVSDEDDAVQD